MIIIIVTAVETSNLTVFSSSEYWRKIFPLHWRGCLLLCRDVPALEGSNTWSSAVMGIYRPVRCSGEGSTKGNSEGDLLIGIGNLMIRRKA
jgi:hypothetical protein